MSRPSGPFTSCDNLSHLSQSRQSQSDTMSISKTEFARRRKNLMALMDPNSIAIIPSARAQVRSRDTEYSFRQDSDFYYLLGLPNRKRCWC